jgi:hypothetical protein
MTKGIRVARRKPQEDRMKSLSISLVLLALVFSVAPAVRAQSLYPNYSVTADCMHWYAGTGAGDTLKSAGFATIHGSRGYWTKVTVAIGPKSYKNTASRVRLDLCRDGVLRGRFYFNYGGGNTFFFRTDSVFVRKTANTDTVDVYLFR